MIEILFQPREYTVSIQGHAGSAPKGQDLVCCAVSTLWGALIANMAVMEGQGKLETFHKEEEPGKAMLTAKPANNSVTEIYMIFRTICAGLECLANEHPEYIRYEIQR